MDIAQSLGEEPISRLGPLPLHAASPYQSVLDALRIMQSDRVGCVLVCEGKTPIGVITERDILRRMGTAMPLDVPLADCVPKRLWTVRETDSIKTAIARMHEHQCRNLVVVSTLGEAVGLLSVRRLVRVLVEHFPSSVYNLPPTANQVPKSPEGA